MRWHFRRQDKETGARLSRQADKKSIGRHHPRRGSLCPKLIAHLLDLRGLCFKRRREGLNFLLLLGYGRLLLSSAQRYGDGIGVGVARSSAARQPAPAQTFRTSSCETSCAIKSGSAVE